MFAFLIMYVIFYPTGVLPMNDTSLLLSLNI